MSRSAKRVACLATQEARRNKLAVLVKSALSVPTLIATGALLLLGATAPCIADVGRRPVDCAAIVSAAGLKAVGQTGPIGQMQIWGDPVAFGPNLRRVEVGVFGSGEYDVDVTINSHCNVISATTRLETSGPP